MEDIEKYVFDPENPSSFKAYDLLIRLAEQKPNAAFFDPNFFSVIYQNDIFNDNLKKRLWDFEGDYEQLTWQERGLAFIKNYSEGDFLEYLDEIADSVIKENPKKYINSYLSIEESRLSISSNLNLLTGYHFRGLREKVRERNKSKLELSSYNNSILFLTRKYYSLINHLIIDKTIIIITLIDEINTKNTSSDFNERWISTFKRKKIRPILLKNISDVNILLDFLGRDIQSVKIKAIEKAQEISPLKSLSLKNYFTIKNIQLTNLKDQKEIYFLGKNGVGKTKLLQAILLAVRGNPNEGEVLDTVKENPNNKLELKSELANGVKYSYTQKPKKEGIYKNIVAYGVNRFRNDSEQRDETGFLTLFSHEQYLNSPEQWLKYLDYKEARNENGDISLVAAKGIIKDILEEITEIKVSPDEVLFYEKGIPKSFGQLSDGFKTLIIWICDMTIRFAEKQPHATSTRDFSGIVLVDEIGMFLHPTWQYSLMTKIRGWFPNIQFIFTTHSPIEVMGASRDAVFYKLYKENGETKVGQPVENKSIAHLMLNGIVTAPFLFELPSARQVAFNENEDELDTSEDYLFSKIHQAIKNKVAEKQNITEQEIEQMISDELSQIELALSND